MGLRVGIFSVVDHYPAELPRTTARFYEELLEQVQATESLGFDSFWVAEHHFHEYGAVPSPPVWLAAAAQRTRRIRLGADAKRPDRRAKSRTRGRATALSRPVAERDPRYAPRAGRYCRHQARVACITSLNAGSM